MTSAVAKFDDAGTFIGSSFVYATARDFAKFGALYLNDGVCNGVRLLPEGWVAYAGEIAGHEDEMNWDYGAHWWIPPGDPKSIVAHGYQGQLIWVAPHRNLILVRLGITDAEFGGAVRDQLLNIALQFPEVSGAR
jgi:CubicO group peptidase (beta-lactamase class C family)